MKEVFVEIKKTNVSPRLPLEGRLDLTYRCNDNCVFCFNQKHINKSPELSLAEIKRKFADACRRWPVSRVLLTGGEPTLHPQFWEIMDFFYKNVVRMAFAQSGGGDADKAGVFLEDLKIPAAAVAHAGAKPADKLKDFLRHLAFV